MGKAAGSFLLVSLFLALIASGPSRAGDDREVRSTLNIELQALAAKNYRRLKPEFVELLQSGEKKQLKVQLEADGVYAIVATCDSDCSHVVIALRDERGELVGESPEQRSTVSVGGSPPASGAYSIEVGVPGCGKAECYAGVLVLKVASEEQATTDLGPAIASKYAQEKEIKGDEERRRLEAQLAEERRRAEAERNRAEDLLRQLEAQSRRQETVETYRVKGNVSDGILNMRTGPGTGHSIIIAIPAGAGNLLIGDCRAPDDGRSRFKWCLTRWQGYSGWVSSGSIEPIPH